MQLGQSHVTKTRRWNWIFGVSEQLFTAVRAFKLISDWLSPSHCNSFMFMPHSELYKQVIQAMSPKQVYAVLKIYKFMILYSNLMGYQNNGTSKKCFGKSYVSCLYLVTLPRNFFISYRICFISYMCVRCLICYVDMRYCIKAQL